MRVLATAMFIAFAVLASIGGKETETNWAALGRNTNGDRTIRHLDKASAQMAEPAQDRPDALLTPWQAIGGMMSVVKDAFNEPSLIEYAKEQGAGIPDSPTAPLSVNSNQRVGCSRLSPNQSRADQPHQTTR